MDIIQSPRPLMLGCSGGGGHNTAIIGIIKSQSSDVVLREYLPIDPKSRDSSALPRRKIDFGIRAVSLPLVGKRLQSALHYTPFPVLPLIELMIAEVIKLSPKPDSSRKYIDMLLDVYPAGYESAAIWNILQSQDQVDELKKLIKLQPQNDKENYEAVKNYFLTQLKNAYTENRPYTEIISTQAMGLPALCDAVIEYNSSAQKQENTNEKPVCIQQYMTDLATDGAVHFFKPLSILSPTQQKIIKLYGVKLNKDCVSRNLPLNHQFEIIEIPPEKNPMVRSGFKDPELDRSHKFQEKIELKLAKEGQESISYTIGPNERIASIMLGSQAGKDSYAYIESLLSTGCQKIFVFCGNGESDLRKKIQDFLDKNSNYKDRILSLDNQSDQEMAPLISRSNVVIIRGGGLSVMEQMAMKHSKEQTVLLHHTHSKSPILTSGISWEDHNANSLIEQLQDQGVYSKKTSPVRALRDLQEAQLISALKKKQAQISDVSECINYVQSLSQDNLDKFLEGMSILDDKSNIVNWTQNPWNINFNSDSHNNDNGMKILNTLCVLPDLINLDKILETVTQALQGYILENGEDRLGISEEESQSLKNLQNIHKACQTYRAELLECSHMRLGPCLGAYETAQSTFAEAIMGEDSANSDSYSNFKSPLFKAETQAQTIAYFRGTAIENECRVLLQKRIEHNHALMQDLNDLSQDSILKIPFVNPVLETYETVHNSLDSQILLKHFKINGPERLAQAFAFGFNQYRRDKEPRSRVNPDIAHRGFSVRYFGNLICQNENIDNLQKERWFQEAASFLGISPKELCLVILKTFPQEKAERNSHSKDASHSHTHRSAQALFQTQFEALARELRAMKPHSNQTYSSALLRTWDSKIQAFLKEAEKQSWELRGVSIDGQLASLAYDNSVLDTLNGMLQRREALLKNAGVLNDDPALAFRSQAGRLTTYNLKEVRFEKQSHTENEITYQDYVFSQKPEIQRTAPGFHSAWKDYLDYFWINIRARAWNAVFALNSEAVKREGVVLSQHDNSYHVPKNTESNYRAPSSGLVIPQTSSNISSNFRKNTRKV